MPLFLWSDSLSVGEATIDRQHQTLVELINKVHDARQADEQDEEVMRALSSMYLYAKEHFFDEEAYMERLGYPDRALHVAQHKAFVVKTHALTDACLAGTLDYSELLAFLVGWLRVHIADEDSRIMRFANSRAGS